MKFKRAVTLAAVCQFVCSIWVYAQNAVKFNHLSVEDGLSQSSVLSITQDDIGFMWFGCGYALNKFDGKNFKIYHHIPNNPKSISSDNSVKVYKGLERKIWVLTLSGLDYYREKSDDFVNVLKFEGLKCFYQEQNGRIWLGTYNGLLYADDPKKIKFKLLSLLPYSKGVVINTVFKDNDNKIWVGSNKGLFCINKGKITSISYLKNFNISTITQDANLNFWLGTIGKGVLVLNFKTGAIIKNLVQDVANKESLASSYGNAYKNTSNPKYKEVLIQSAKSLISRFNPVIGSIESWNSRKSWDGKTFWDYPVIIDNLMNLELLFFASKATGDNIYKDIAIKHAETSLKYHIRPDFSTYHVVNYDTLSGKMLHRQTCQGYADNSTWARGQAWAIYGYTMIYRETQDKKFLNAAIGLTDFFLKHKNLPKDYIPYWDFNVNEQGYKPDFKYNASIYKEIPRDASAAAVVASALLELCKYSPEKKTYYINSAQKILESLSSPKYLAQVGTNNNFLLKHSTGSLPHNEEVNVPLVYADYYYLEALLRYKNFNN